jgi:hypothetical protein
VPVAVRLIGREKELEVADEFFGAALSGGGSALVVEGEAGIGKTTRRARKLVVWSWRICRGFVPEPGRRDWCLGWSR